MITQWSFTNLFIAKFIHTAPKTAIEINQSKDGQPAGPPFKKRKQQSEECSLNLNDLPVLPFKEIPSYLSLEDQTRSRAVSLKWYLTIDSFRVKSLFYSERPIGLWGKSRLISGVFAQNSIALPNSAPEFDSFIRKSFSENALKIPLEFSNLPIERLFWAFVLETNRKEIEKISSFALLAVKIYIILFWYFVNVLPNIED